MSNPGLWTDSQLYCAGNILVIARKYYSLCHIPDLAFLGVTKQESDWNETAAGDSNQSFGPFQIYVAAHPHVGPEISTNPGWDYGFWEMHERWTGAWLPFSMQWRNGSTEERGIILENFAPAAQGSIAWSSGLGIQRYMESVAMLEQLS